MFQETIYETVVFSRIDETEYTIKHSYNISKAGLKRQLSWKWKTK